MLKQKKMTADSTEVNGAHTRGATNYYYSPNGFIFDGLDGPDDFRRRFVAVRRSMNADVRSLDAMVTIIWLRQQVKKGRGRKRKKRSNFLKKKVSYGAHVIKARHSRHYLLHSAQNGYIRQKRQTR